MDNNKSKSQAFIELLPQIYKRILISKDNYRVICNWLKKEHGLDFFEKSDKEDSEKTYYLFTNYLKKYGNVKKAKEHYIENVNTNIEENWWKDFVDENNKPITTSVNRSSSVNNSGNEATPKLKEDYDSNSLNGETNERVSRSNSLVSKSKPKTDHTSLASSLGLSDSPAKNIDYNSINPLEDFDESICK